MTLRILVVCTANVCRSPMGEALLRHHCAALGVDVAVASAGTGAYGLPVDPTAVLALGELGLDISPHQPRRVEPATLESDGADLVLTMTREHVRSVATMPGGGFRRTFTLREFVRHAAITDLAGGAGLESWLAAVALGRRASDLMGDSPGDDIADPYGLSLATHRDCATELNMLTETVARALKMMTAAGT
jgi:protein-tyrosine phosphatase